jgi:hypothetical protein
MLARRVVAIVGLSLLGATEASAACAWVLWVRAAPADRASSAIVGAWTSWAPHGATTEAAGCDDLTPKNPDSNRRAVRATGVNLTANQVAQVEWQCLPDTIDPRGPKGGGR